MSEFFQIPVSSAVSPSTPSTPAGSDARREALSIVKGGADKLIVLSDVFTAFRELLYSNSGEGLSLSGDGGDGLVHMLKLLADDASSAGLELDWALKVLNEESAHE